MWEVMPADRWSQEDGDPPSQPRDAPGLQELGSTQWRENELPSHGTGSSIPASISESNTDRIAKLEYKVAALEAALILHRRRLWWSHGMRWALWLLAITLLLLLWVATGGISWTN